MRHVKLRCCITFVAWVPRASLGFGKRSRICPEPIPMDTEGPLYWVPITRDWFFEILLGPPTIPALGIPAPNNKVLTWWLGLNKFALLFCVITWLHILGFGGFILTNPSMHFNMNPHSVIVTSHDHLIKPFPFLWDTQWRLVNTNLTPLIVICNKLNMRL